MIQSYRDLIVWQKSMDLAEHVYRLLDALPKVEKFALADQIRRAAISIPSNIAEGYGRERDASLKYFLEIAAGSRAELQTQLLLCERLGYFTREQTRQALLLTEEVGKMLHALKGKLDS